MAARIAPLPAARPPAPGLPDTGLSDTGLPDTGLPDTGLSDTGLSAFQAVIAAIAADHGYVPNSFLTLARHPAMLRATGLLADALWYDDRLPQPIRRLAGFAFSWFSGVMYSSAHLACGAEDLGLPLAKLLAVDDWETHPVYTAAERAVLRVCRHAARMPAEITDGDMHSLRAELGEEQALLIVGLIAWHAFLNRWNMIVATELEAPPLAHARARLAPMGWHPGPHAPPHAPPTCPQGKPA